MHSRILQFRAGPNEVEFLACDEHLKYITDDPPSAFFIDVRDEIKFEGPDEDFAYRDCYFCREP